MNMESVKGGIREVGKHLAEIAQAVVKAMDNLTPEQRLVIEFLAENPKVAEAFQELNQRLARQKAIGGATKEAARPKEPLLKDYPEIMKATRTWADANGLADAFVFCSKYSNGFKAKDMEVYIEFDTAVCDLGDIIEKGKDYGLDELCGEGEE